MEQQYKSLYINIRDLMDKTSSERQDIESQLDSVTKRFYQSDYHIGALVTLKTRSRLHKALHRVLASLKRQECTDLTALHGLANAYLKRLRKLATEQYVTPGELRAHYTSANRSMPLKWENGDLIHIFDLVYQKIEQAMSKSSHLL